MDLNRFHVICKVFIFGPSKKSLVNNYPSAAVVLPRESQPGFPWSVQRRECQDPAPPASTGSAPGKGFLDWSGQLAGFGLALGSRALNLRTGGLQDLDLVT